MGLHGPSGPRAAPDDARAPFRRSMSWACFLKLVVFLAICFNNIERLQAINSIAIRKTSKVVEGPLAPQCYFSGDLTLDSLHDQINNSTNLSILLNQYSNTPQIIPTDKFDSLRLEHSGNVSAMNDVLTHFIPVACRYLFPECLTQRYL